MPPKIVPAGAAKVSMLQWRELTPEVCHSGWTRALEALLDGTFRPPSSDVAESITQVSRDLEPNLPRAAGRILGHHDYARPKTLRLEVPGSALRAVDATLEHVDDEEPLTPKEPVTELWHREIAGIV